MKLCEHVNGGLTNVAVKPTIRVHIIYWNVIGVHMFVFISSPLVNGIAKKQW